jgi:hypothetical protein
VENSLNLSNVGRQAPPVPSKWDIIPIHTSDRGTFKNCRRQWAWSSPARHNLIPKTRITGIREPLWFGTGIHYALERYYHPMLKEDPVVTWLTWFDLQWNGGIVTEQEISEHGFHDREPVLSRVGRAEPEGLLLSVPEDNVTAFYHVKGLSELLPDPDEDHFMEVRDLGRGMMEFYKTYAEREDNFTVMMVEHTFSVPILKPDGSPLYMLDNRQMPDDYEYEDPEGGIPENSYGPLWYYEPDGVYKQVHARGRMDVIVQDNESGRFGIIDHKTAARIDEDYFRHLDLDEQCTTYLWAAEREAEMYGLEYNNMDFVIYQALLKGYPKPPTLTTRGVPSINRQTETTTPEMFEQLINTMGLKEYFETDEKMQAYYTWLLEIGDSRFINREPVRRNRHQKESCGNRLYLEAMDMLNDPSIYPSPSKSYNCLNCIFRTPCIGVEDGSDYEDMLNNNYMPNWDR